MFSSSVLILLFVFVCQCHCSFETESYVSISEVRKFRELKRNTKATKEPCTCTNEACNCCANIVVEGNASESCASIRIPDMKKRNQMVRYSFNFNDQKASQTAPAGRDPSPICVNVPNLIGVQICAVFYEVHYDSGIFRACFRIELKVASFTIIVLEFDCLTVELFKGVTFMRAPTTDRPRSTKPPYALQWSRP